MRALTLGLLALFLVAPELRAIAPEPARTPAGPGKVFLTVEEALELAFGDARVVRERIFLTPDEAERIEELGSVDLSGRMVYAYRATRDGDPVGTAYFDNHKVRSMKETLMFVVDPADEIQRVEVLAFAEPLDYLPRARWYGQFLGKGLDDELDLKRGIRSVTGATLTARATAEAARRSLAIHRVIGDRDRTAGGGLD